MRKRLFSREERAKENQLNTNVVQMSKSVILIIVHQQHGHPLLILDTYELVPVKHFRKTQ